MPSYTRIGLLALLLLFCGVAGADQLVMKNGDRLTGTVVNKAGDWLTFETAYAGKLKIKWADVAELSLDQPVTVLLKDETLGQAQRFAADPQGDALSTDGVSYINPPPELSGQGYSFTGRVNVGLKQTTGNTDTEAYHVDAEGIYRTKGYRVTVGAIVNEQSDSGVQSVSNATLSAKYDRFLTEKWYVYGHTKLQKDKFKDLKLRSEIGLGAGYQLFDGPDRKLSFEAGLTQVNNDYDVAPDDESLALRWATDYEELFWKDLLTFFHRHELTMAFEDTSDFVVITKTGIRVPVANHLNTTFQVDADYDNQPSAGTDETDLTYLFTLGYSW
jgi:putative salt-induced outer membrane protein YdiY